MGWYITERGQISFLYSILKTGLCKKWEQMAYKSHIRSCIYRKYQAIKTRKVLNQNLASIQYLVPPYLQGISSKTISRCLKHRELLNFNSARNVAAASSSTDTVFPIIFMFLSPNLFITWCHLFQGIPCWSFRVGSMLSGPRSCHYSEHVFCVFHLQI